MRCFLGPEIKRPHLWWGEKGKGRLPGGGGMGVFRKGRQTGEFAAEGKVGANAWGESQKHIPVQGILSHWILAEGFRGWWCGMIMVTLTEHFLCAWGRLAISRDVFWLTQLQGVVLLAFGRAAGIQGWDALKHPSGHETALLPKPAPQRSRNPAGRQPDDHSTGFRPLRPRHGPRR